MRYVFFRTFLASFICLVISLAGSSRAQAVQIAIIDSGSNLNGVTGTDYVRGDSVPNDETSDLHGTTISRVIASYIPVQDIIALKVVPGSFQFNSALSTQALADAVANPDVGVIDLSNRNPITLADLQAAADGKRVIVMNAGNRAGSRPDGIAEFAPLLNGVAIIVGAVDPDGSIAPYSNRAGILADYYVVAPGFNSFSSTQGTSFAKPHVSALAALLLDLFPNLKPKDAVKIILETATDLGEPGVDPVYGHGRVNFEAALGPEGEMLVPSSSSSNTGIVILGAAAVGAAVVALTRKKPLETTLVLDEYNRGYTLDLTKISQVKPDRGSIGSILKALNTLEQTHVVGQSADSLAFIRVTKPTLENSVAYNPTSWLNDDEGFLPEPSMSYYQQSLDGSGYSFHFNQGLTQEFGALGLSSRPEDQISFLSSKVFSSPFLGFSNNGYASRIVRPFSENSSVSFGVSRVDEETQYGLRSDAAAFEVTHHGERFSTSATFGQLYEYGSLFGGSSGGPYSVNDTLTFSFGLSGSYRLAPNVRVIGNYTQGYSMVDSSSNSLVTNFSSVRSDSWGMGLLFDNVFSDHDRVGFAVSQPLKITDGSADLTVPHTIDANNVISRTTDRVDLSSGSRELALESFYRLWSGKHARFTTYLMHQQHPLDRPDVAAATSVLGVFEYHF